MLLGLESFVCLGAAELAPFPRPFLLVGTSRPVPVRPPSVLPLARAGASSLGERGLRAWVLRPAHPVSRARPRPHPAHGSSEKTCVPRGHRGKRVLAGVPGVPALTPRPRVCTGLRLRASCAQAELGGEGPVGVPLLSPGVGGLS